MANVKQFDRIIQLAERKLQAVERRELWPLTGPERRRLLAAGFTGGVKVVRHKSTAKADRTIETTWANAAARLRSEITAAQRQKQQFIDKTAADKVAKKAGSWWR